MPSISSSAGIDATIYKLMVNPKAVNILGVDVNTINKRELLELVRIWAGENKPRSISYVNAHCINVAYKDSEYREALKKMDLVYADGMGVVMAGRFLYGSYIKKITGRDWIDNFCKLAVNQHLRVYILAGKPGILSLAIERMRKEYPELDIAGFNDGFFTRKSENEVLYEIKSTRPHIVFIGMGIPQQEKWVGENRGKIIAPVCWNVGALFDYVAGLEPQVPGWMDKIALEWLWRLMMDPSGKWKRYLVGNPLFILRILYQKLSL